MHTPNRSQQGRRSRPGRLMPWADQADIARGAITRQGPENEVIPLTHQRQLG